MLVALVGAAGAFYLPGLAPVTYCTSKESATCSSEIKLFVNRLNSEESVIPYEYHHFDFCKADESNAPHENLGQVGFTNRNSREQISIKW